jgi:hypothetical protein
MQEREEKTLDANEKRFIALKFREAILNQDRRVVAKLTEKYNPHYVHAAFVESAEYPGEVNAFRFAREVAEHGRAPVSDDFKKFLMRTVLGAIVLMLPGVLVG